MRPLSAIFAVLIGVGLGQHPSRAQKTSASNKSAIDKGLAWLVKRQNKDGSWSNYEKQPDVACTGAAGLALLMEGSTAVKGKYAENIKQAVGWLEQNCQKDKDDGLFGSAARQNRLGYMSGQSYAVLFLASALAREEKSDARDLEGRLAKVRQRAMEEVLQRGVQFIVKAQATSGGWATTSRGDSQDQDDAASTAEQIFALRAAQQAGIAVPKDTMHKAGAYLEKMTTPRGGIPFSFRDAGASGRERPGLTIAAVAATYGAEEIKADLLKKWLDYCQFTITLRDENYDFFHLAVAVHGLGDEGHAKLLGKKEPTRVWSKDRDMLLSRFTAIVQSDGMVRSRWNPNPVFVNAINLIALQLDNEYVPVFRKKEKW